MVRRAKSRPPNPLWRTFAVARPARRLFLSGAFHVAKAAMAYRSEDKRDRWKAILGVLLVHVVLGAAILTGLNVNIVGEAVERLETFDVALEQPPPEEPPPAAGTGAAGARRSGCTQSLAGGCAPSRRCRCRVKARLPPLRRRGLAPRPHRTGRRRLGHGGRRPVRAPVAGRRRRGYAGKACPKIPNSDYRSRWAGPGFAEAHRRPLPFESDREDGSTRAASSARAGIRPVDSGLCALVRPATAVRPARDPQGRPVT
jgi:periplasmic protein TonB